MPLWGVPKSNARTKPDCYAVPHIHDLGILFNGKKMFSKVDLLKAYQHIPVAGYDIKKTGIITPIGNLWCFLF